MEGTRPSTVNSIGMFDMLKGMGMITIVLAHTAELYPMQISGGLSLTAFFPFIYREALMAAFFIASGYGFRKRSIGKCIQQQLRALLKPYCITAVCTSLLHLLCHYMAFHYFPSSVTETLKVAGGFLLGLPHTTTYAGQQFFSTGPMWYLLSLLIGWVLLDAILNIFPEKYTHWAVLGIMLLGWGTTGTFSPAAPTRSEQSDNAVPVETIQLEQLRICPGNTFSVRTSQPLSASRNGSVLSLRRQWQLFQRHSENDITITLPAAQFAQLEQAVNTTKRSDQK